MLILTCKLGNEIINCYDGTHDKEQLKKWSSKKILLCPVCGKPYEYCHGKVKTPYFRHMDKNECEDRFPESETEEHLNGKRDLFEWIKKQNGVTNAVLEGWIPETKQRPDIMFDYNNEKFVIEFQCTPIATEYEERHALYKASGINDIWVLGVEKYLKPNMREKYIEGYSDCFYDTATKRLTINGDTERLFLSANKRKRDRIKRKYSHSQNSFYGFSINNFGFDYNIIFKKYEQLMDYDLKHYKRMEKENEYINKLQRQQQDKAEKIISVVNKKTKGKYRSKYRLMENNSAKNMYLHASNLIKLYTLLEKLKVIIGENNNWIIDFYVENGSYKIIALPNVDSDFELYKDYRLYWKFWQKVKAYHLYIPTINLVKVTELVNNVNLIKEKLVDVMQRNKSIILNLNLVNKRYLEACN